MFDPGMVFGEALIHQKWAEVEKDNVFTSFVCLNMLFHYSVAVCFATEQQNGVNSSDKNNGKKHKNPVRYGRQWIITEG